MHNVYTGFMYNHSYEKYIFKITAMSRRSQQINPYGAETGIFQEKWVSVMAADALAPCIARSSADMGSFFHELWFQLQIASCVEKWQTIQIYFYIS